MSEDPHSAGGPPTYRQPGARTPTHAERARTLVARRGTGTLSTLALDPAGHPYGSVATYTPDGSGAPLVLMSEMAEHARNLTEDPRCSLLVTAPARAGTDRLAGERATLLGETTRLPGEDQEEAVATYLRAHPGAFWARFPDFHVHRLEITTIRYVRGFGEMSWVEAADYADAEPDSLAADEAGIVEHMNEDHREGLREMADYHLEVDGRVTDAEMLGCDRYGFEVRMTVAGDDEPFTAFGRLGFPEPLEDASAARGAMIDLVRAARSAGAG